MAAVKFGNIASLKRQPGLSGLPQPMQRGMRAMPLTPKGHKIMSAMKHTYGAKKGEQVFYASRNAGKIKGVDPESRSPRRRHKVRYPSPKRPKSGGSY